MEQSICIFGASSTQGFYDVEKGGWADRLKIYLYEKNLKTENYFEVFNLGVSGNTSRELLSRFSNEASSRKPTVIIISLGDNDSALGVPVHEYEKNLNEVFIQARMFTRNVIVLGAKKVNEALTNPVPWKSDAFYRNSEIEKYDKKLKSLAEIHGFDYIPMIEVLDSQDLEDGVHPNSLGHQKIFEVVKTFLENKRLI